MFAPLRWRSFARPAPRLKPFWRPGQDSWRSGHLSAIDSPPRRSLSPLPNKGRHMAKYDSILGTVGNTPCVRINRLAPEGVNLYVKVEAFNPLGSVKDRLALGVIEA